MFCSKCGKENLDDAKFCSSCGANIGIGIELKKFISVTDLVSKKLKKIPMIITVVVGLILIGLVSSYRLISDGVFIDTDTGLMWQDDYSTRNDTRHWQESIDYCDNLSLAGFDDWQLPDNNTLLDLYTKRNKLKYVIPYAYWSSSEDVNKDSDAWRVFFENGDDDAHGKGNNYLVRCVRTR